MITGTIKSIKIVAGKAAVNFKLTITVSNTDQEYIINAVNLIKILKAIGEYPSSDVADDIDGYEIQFNADTFNRISNVSLVEVQEVGD